MEPAEKPANDNVIFAASALPGKGTMATNEALRQAMNELAGQFEAKRLIGIKQLVDELWAQSATWPRTPWWLRMWDRVRSWF